MIRQEGGEEEMDMFRFLRGRVYREHQRGTTRYRQKYDRSTECGIYYSTPPHQ